MGTSSKELARKLQKLAKRQHGCFTASQAIEIGYADSVHLYHVKTGNWTRLFRGVYRFTSATESPASRCMAALLWTRDKRGKIQGVLTQETADALQTGKLGLADPIQVAVGKGFRRSSDVPEGIRLTMIDPQAHKPLKVAGLPALVPASAAKEPVPVPPARAAPGEMDMADYYDWLDYQAVRCPPDA